MNKLEKPGRPRRHANNQRKRETEVPEGYLAVGKIVGLHGLRGEVKVELYTDFPERFAVNERLDLGKALKSVAILGSRPHKGHMLLFLEGTTSRSAAEGLRNEWLYVKEENAANLEEDTYWVHDIIGLAARDEDGLELGTIKDVLFTGANEVYVIQPAGNLNKGQDILIPAIADVIQVVDVDEGIMTIRLQPGLIEE